MMNPYDDTIDGNLDSVRHPLDALAEEFADALRAGERPSIEAYADRVPNQREDAIALLRSIQMFERVSGSDASSKGPKSVRLNPASPPSFGDFRLVREIGRGGMGVIYEAEQLSLKRNVALKVLGNVSDSPKQLERFRRESEAVARLHHTNIVPVFAVGEENGFHYFAMQLIHGRPLNHAPALSLVDIARIGMQAANALAYAHSRGVLHRDIKPSNMILDEDRNVWVTDFGLAKLTDVGELTQTGDIMGTLKYMAPEQLTGEADERTDVYGLGLTLYELATGQPAFDISKSLIDRIRAHAFPAPRSIKPEIPKDLETIILKATALERTRRYANAAALEEDLRRFIEDRPVLARRESGLEKLNRWIRRNPALAGSLTAVIVLLAATAAVGVGGYVVTSHALDEARSARDAANTAKIQTESSQARAESNLAVAMQAFDAIFDNVASRGIPQLSVLDDEDNPTITPTFSALTPDDANLLTKLLNFYRDFAKQNESDKSLLLKTAMAYKRCGQIQQRLGRIDDALVSLDESLKILARLRERAPADIAYGLAIAQALNERGFAMSFKPMEVPQIVDYHHTAIDLLRELKSADPSRIEIRFELARGLDLAGSLMSRSNALIGFDAMPALNPPPPKKEGLGPELSPKDRPRARQPDDGFRRDRAPRGERPVGPPPNGMRPPRPENPQDGPPGVPPPFENESTRPFKTKKERRFNPRDFNDLPSLIDSELRESIELLAGLCEEVPDSDEFQLTHSTALEHRMRHNLMWGRFDLATESFQQARKSLEGLVEKHPDHPQYMVELAETLATAGSRLIQSLSEEERMDNIRRAVKIAEQLTNAFPDILEYQGLHARCNYKLAVMEREHRNGDVAMQLFQDVIDRMTRLHHRSPDNRAYVFNRLQAAIDLTMMETGIGKLSDLEVRKNQISRLESALAPLVAPKTDEFLEPHIARICTNGLEQLGALYRMEGDNDQEREVRRNLEKIRSRAIPFPPFPGPPADRR